MKTPKSGGKEKNKTEQIMKIVAQRAGYYRHNVSRFVEDYLQIKYLKPFQKILLHEMFENDNFLFVACRGLGKTFLIALFAICRCILYPGTKVVIASSTFKQAKEVVEKITNEFMHKSPMLRSEIEKCSIGQNDCGVYFKNGSYMICKVASENARGARANILIIDESRMVSRALIDSVFIPMLNAPRSPGYLNKEKYRHLQEIGKKYYLTSAWYCQSELYTQLKDETAMMLSENSKFFVCDIPYQCSIESGILMRETIETEMAKQTFNEISFMMEYEGKFYGASSDALFSYDNLNDRRTLVEGLHDLDFYKERKESVPRKQINEKRILSLDVALLASVKHDNDASCFIINQLMESGDEQVSNIAYIETKEGLLTEDLGLLAMRYFYQYDCDYFALDANGVGQPVLDYIMKDRYDPMYGVTYKAMTTINRSDLNIRCKVKDANKVIYALKATAKDNNDMCVALRSAFQNGYINLLINENEFNEKVAKRIKGYSKLNFSQQEKLKLPYMQTSSLINELINLEHDTSGNLIKVKEKYGMRKDRFSSLEYNYYVVEQLRIKERPRNNKNDLTKMFTVRKPLRFR